MKVKILKPEEWDLLEQSPDPVLSPEMATVVAAVEDGKLLGKMMLVMIPHLEGPWIHPQQRGKMLLARMEEQLVAKLREHGAAKVFGFAIDDTMESYFKRRGYRKMHYTVWEKEI